MKKKIGVIFGGNSVEHEISIITALQAIENIDKNKYDVIALYIDKENNWYSDQKLLEIEYFKDDKKIVNELKQVYLTKNKNKVEVRYKKNSMFSNSIITEIDIIFMIVHGTNVEDGTLTGLIESLDIPYIGPSVLSGAIGQDKAVMKDILKANDIVQTKYLWYYDDSDYEEIIKQSEEKLGYPVILKPASLGSSVGIEIVYDKNEFTNALESCFSFCNKIVIEEVLEEFEEVNISIVGNYKQQMLSKTELVSKSDEILSYEDKYMNSSKTKSSGMASLSRIIPAPISEDLINRINNITTKTFKVLNSQGVVRIDLMIKDEIIYLNEINNIPGSLSFYLWEKTNLEYKMLIEKLIEIAVENYFARQKITFSIDTNVLNMEGLKIKK